MGDFKLGSHDTMTYLTPREWYLYPFKFMAQCQCKTIQQQFEKYGIRYFDLRVRFLKNGELTFAHGLMTYKANVEDVLDYLNSHGEEVWVRFLLELTKADPEQEAKFKEVCEIFEKRYTNLKFHNGRRKYDWTVVYKFQNPEPSLDQKISSMTWKIWDDWCPFFYAFFMNKKNVKKGTDKDYLLLDFLQIQ